MRNLTIAKTAAFVEWAEPRISNIAMIVVCASIKAYIPITTARVENINPIVQCARNIFSVREVRRMRCLAAMRFIGSVFDSWQLMIRGVQFARRLPKRETE